MSKLNEALQTGDLRFLVDDIFEVDSYASKMGDDQDIVVLSFTVESLEPAKDLVNFIERGYDFVLDADSTPGEMADTKYKVFVELERNRRVAEQIMEILDGVGKLANIEGFKFRYYKSFESLPVDETSLKEAIPGTKDEYTTRIKEGRMNNFSNFFNRSYLESIEADNDTLVFRKKYAEPLRMRIRGAGATSAVYESAPGRIMLESKHIAEVLYLTKYLGNYNITKVGESFILENDGFAVLLEKV